jgi:hypothetical protein
MHASTILRGLVHFSLVVERGGIDPVISILEVWNKMGRDMGRATGKEV